jgi:hypothetical protein
MDEAAISLFHDDDQSSFSGFSDEDGENISPSLTIPLLVQILQ